MFFSNRINQIHFFQVGILQFFNLLFVFLILKKLSLNELALFGVAKSLVSVSEYSHLGSRFGLDVFLPNSSRVRALKYKVASFSLTTFVNVLFFVLLSIYYKNFLIFVFLFSSTFFNLVNLNRFSTRAEGDTLLFIKQSIFISYIPIILQVIFFFSIGFYGLGIGFFISSIILFFLYHKSITPLIFKPLIFSDLFYLIKKGSPILIFNISFILVTVLDRLVIDQFVSKSLTGYYTFIFLLLSFFMILPNAVSELVMSKIMKRETDSIDKKSFFLKSCFIISLIVLVSTVFFLFLVDFVIILFLPSYMSIIPELKFALFYVFPASLIGILNLELISRNMYRVLNISNVISFLIYYICLLLYLFFEHDYKLFDLVFLRIFYIMSLFILLISGFYRSNFKLHEG